QLRGDPRRLQLLLDRRQPSVHGAAAARVVRREQPDRPHRALRGRRTAGPRRGVRAGQAGVTSAGRRDSARFILHPGSERNMATEDLKHALGPEVSLAPAARTANANGIGVDLQGYDGALIEVATGVITDGTHTIEVKESDDNVTFAA